jgi:hypothetical protein
MKRKEKKKKKNCTHRSAAVADVDVATHSGVLFYYFIIKLFL